MHRTIYCKTHSLYTLPIEFISNPRMILFVNDNSERYRTYPKALCQWEKDSLHGGTSDTFDVVVSIALVCMMTKSVCRSIEHCRVMFVTLKGGKSASKITR